LAGLLFIDFDKGDLLYLTCTAEIIWDSEETTAFSGADRLVRLTLDEGILVEKAMPIRWDFRDYSPSLEQTGSWGEVAKTLSKQADANIYREFRVTRVENESANIRSFYLEPEDGLPIICHQAGQFLPIEIEPPAADGPVRRTYTISNAPNGKYYRLSIKREGSAQRGLPPGVSSNYFHDHIDVGNTVRALTPRGKFSLDQSSNRPVVLLSAGVGITPMISMLEQLLKNSEGCGCSRPIWFIHGATNGNAQAFRPWLSKLSTKYSCLNLHVRYSRPSEDDIEGEGQDSNGHVDIDLVKSLLPFDDHEFYLCGPGPFLESLYAGLKDLNIADDRIHYEFFGPGSPLSREQAGETEGFASDQAGRSPVSVQFAKSGKLTSWDPSRGTLLELAESEGLQPAYSCRSGICQTCSTRITAGAVDYPEPPLSAPVTGEILLCCSYPASEQEAGELILDL
jgi:ferredoxin-NADP reductase